MEGQTDRRSPKSLSSAQAASLCSCHQLELSSESPTCNSELKLLFVTNAVTVPTVCFGGGIGSQHESRRGGGGSAFSLLYPNPSRPFARS